MLSAGGPSSGSLWRRPTRWSSTASPARLRRFGFRVAVLLALALGAGPLAVVAAAEPEQQQAPVVVPGPVTGLELSAEANSVTVSWQAPISGGAPQRYIVHLKPEGGKKGSGKIKRPKAQKTEVVFNNLESGATYTLWVRARNEAGKGERVHAAVTLPEEITLSETESRSETEPPPEDVTPPDQPGDGDGQQQGDATPLKVEKPCRAPGGQSADSVLVGNFDQERRLSDMSTNDFALTQGFTTGDAAATLEGIEVCIGTPLHVAHIATIRAELWSAAAGGEPEAKLVDLVAPDQMGNGDAVFTAPPHTVLDANTAYHFVLYTTGRVDLRVAATFSTDEDPGGQNGWSIADTSYEISAQTPQDGNWVEEPVNGVMSMRIKGH